MKRSILLAAGAAAFLTLSGVAAAQTPLTPPGRPGSAAYEQWLGQTLGRLQQAADRDAIRQLAFHYARGNDELSVHFNDRPLGRTRAQAEYAQAFAPDVSITVYPLRSSTPLRKVSGIADWIAFADGFFENAKYSSSLHLMSNFDIRFTGPDTARASAYAGVPHFIQSTARTAEAQAVTLEYMLCRYDYVAKRQADGSWRITEFTIYLDEIQRSQGFYPGGQASGR
ncbi:MAG: nuclear transport factor 2 family protein [Hyphomonadaceae bacterium]|nr:nuclear transport factor 2 family protein [Hyphomonadaceae bacterium]